MQELDLYGVGVVRAGRKLLPEIEVPKKKKEKNDEAAKKKKKKDIPLVSGKKFKDDKSFQRGESDFLVSKDGLIILRWKDNKTVMLLSNFLYPTYIQSVQRKKKVLQTKPKFLVLLW